MSPSPLLRGLLLGTAAATLSLSPALSQEGNRRPTFLGTLVITDARTEGSALSALSGMSTIDTEAIARSQAPGVSELLRTVPGLAAAPGGDDSSVATNIRGLQQMGRVVVTVDGARQDFWRVGHGSGSVYIDPDMLKQVTVIRGPSSGSYGSGGIGGVVAFETRDASDFLKDGETWAASQRFRWGSNGEGFSTTTSGAMRFGENFDVIGSLSYRDSDAYKDGNGNVVKWTGERVTSGLLKASWRPAPGHELKFGINRSETNEDVTTSSGSPSATPSVFDTDITTSNYTFSWGWKPEEGGPIDLTFKLWRAENRSFQDGFTGGTALGTDRDYNVATNGVSIQNTSRFTTGNWDQSISFGADHAAIKGRFTYVPGTTAVNNTLNGQFGNGTQKLSGVWAQWQGNSGPLEVIASLRWDHYSLQGWDRAGAVVTVSGNRVSPRLSLGYEVAEGIQLFATYAEGYRAPHLQEMFRKSGTHGGSGSYAQNFSLKPEVAKSWELGVNLDRDDVFTGGDSLRGKIVAFTTDVEDYIDTVAVAGVTSYQNVGKARLKGIEIEGSYDWGKGYFDLGANFTEAKMVATGDTLSNTPTSGVTARLGLRAFGDRLDYGIEYQHFDDVTRVLSTGAKYYPKVDLVNLFATWKEGDDYRIDFGVENVFDKAFTDPQSGWSTTAVVDQGRGRTIRLSFTKRLGG